MPSSIASDSTTDDIAAAAEAELGRLQLAAARAFGITMFLRVRRVDTEV
jgi:hypothetical protein